MSILDITDLVQDNTTEIIEWLKENLIDGQYEWLDSHKNIEIKNRVINVNGNINLELKNKDNIPEFIKFGKVTGHFICSNCELTSLRGVPDFVGGSFDCTHNNLTTLKGGPKIVKGNYYASDNKLTSIRKDHFLPKYLRMLNVNRNRNLKFITGLSDMIIESLYIGECYEVRGTENIKHVHFIFARYSGKLINEMIIKGINFML